MKIKYLVVVSMLFLGSVTNTYANPCTDCWINAAKLCDKDKNINTCLAAINQNCKATCEKEDVVRSQETTGKGSDQ